MASARGNEGEEPIINEYEQQRLERIASNKRKLDALKVPRLSNAAHHSQTRKRTKVLINIFVVIVSAHFFYYLHHHVLLLQKTHIQVTLQLEDIIFVQGHKEIMLRMQMSRLVKIIVNQLEISYVTMMVMMYYYYLTALLISL